MHFLRQFSAAKLCAFVENVTAHYASDRTPLKFRRLSERKGSHQSSVARPMIPCLACCGTCSYLFLKANVYDIIEIESIAKI